MSISIAKNSKKNPAAKNLYPFIFFRFLIFLLSRRKTTIEPKNTTRKISIIKSVIVYRPVFAESDIRRWYTLATYGLP